MQAFLIIFVSFWLPYSSLASGNWCYTSQDASCGPDHWSVNHPDCGKQKQSPIDIVTKMANHLPSLCSFVFRGYDQIPTKKPMIKNTGHSVQVTLEETNTISGGGLANTYKALQLHFHWGTTTTPGAEHTIDGTRYPMEMHIVHRNEKYKNMEEALNHTDGVAVLGFLFKETKEINSNYKDIINHLNDVKSNDQKVSMTPFALKSLLPSDTDLKHYYRYEGSLTTPSCQEAVIWTIFPNPIPLRKDQLNAFPTSLYFSKESEKPKPMVSNYRPIQKLNNRVVYTSKGVRPTSAAVLTVVFVAYLSTSFN
ncbi:carbonic anhydrase 4a isoform X2 [Callorhinchus milii]|uniref:carbonic anhydrase n=1 Tax=Callorhinchus milii TaxID=7868 RepID=A0A4W3JGS1_CALMI|nr:carbonic anhydrase 4a isoform X2 [Callorhinchus milii]|eukprot:gi/632957978/ref/XP_007894777.1/ PREDICTED: carbonic anhydrase 15-like [Callorhinchus milii]